MSTSLETSQKASPSNSDRAQVFKRDAFLIAVSALAGAAVCFVCVHIPDFRERRAAARAVAPLVEQARLWPMTYETAEAGKPVVWCVDHPAKGVSYLSGRPSEPLVWVDESGLPITNSGISGYCAKVAAIVEGRGPRGVKLRFVAAL